MHMHGTQHLRSTCARTWKMPALAPVATSITSPSACRVEAAGTAGGLAAHRAAHSSRRGVRSAQQRPRTTVSPPTHHSLEEAGLRGIGGPGVLVLDVQVDDQAEVAVVLVRLDLRQGACRQPGSVSFKSARAAWHAFTNFAAASGRCSALLGRNARRSRRHHRVVLFAYELASWP